MKPRLKELPQPTPEELDASVLSLYLCSKRGNYELWNAFAHGSKESDRRDAELMWILTRRQDYERSTCEYFDVSMPFPAAIYAIYFDVLTNARRTDV